MSISENESSEILTEIIYEAIDKKIKERERDIRNSLPDQWLGNPWLRN